MDRGKYEDRRRIGSVKAAVNMYGDMILDGNSSLKKPQEGFPEKPSPRVKEFHRARRSLSRYKESRKTAESELFGSRETVNDSASMVEESNLKAKRNGLVAKSMSVEGYQYEEVMRELELVKQELSQLKLDMASVMEEKAGAKKEFEDSNSRLKFNGASVEALREQIEAAKEEHVLAELAQIEAQKEAGETEAQRAKEAGEFSFWIEETRKKREDMIEEIDQTKGLETKLGVTLSGINLLQDQLKQVKGPDSVIPRGDGDGDGLKQQDDSFPSVEKVEISSSLESIKKELEAAKKELDSIKDEGFQYTSSMDIIRNELQHVKEETAKLKKTEENVDSKVKILNTKLVRAKSKLEAATAAEEKAKSIESNLSLTLEQSRAEAEASKKEKMLITDDIATIKAEIQKTESEIDVTEERLQAAMQELEAVKSSEALALEKLRSLIETTMQSRASASNHSTSMTVSRFEYEYLTGHALGAEEIADKKVAAAQAWIEALKASEREILMKTEKAHRELTELRVDEETDVSLSAKENVDSPNKQLPSIRVRSMKINGNSTPSRRIKLGKSASPAILRSGSTPFTSNTKRK